jgi:RNA polymerase sigma-70 factor (ECF subfamily)
VEPAAATTSASALDRVAREEGGVILAGLTRRLGGDIERAEEALQEAYAIAAAAWARDGVPANAAAWLTTAARRRALDRLRRDRVHAARVGELAALAERLRADPEETQAMDLDDPEASRIDDDRLALIFTCCHPALALDVRVALTVKSLGGLSVAQVARAFFVSESTMARRLVRARRKIATAGIPFRVPPDALLPERLAGVLRVVYLIYTEGHAAADGDALQRPELCVEALRLAALLARLMPDDPEVLGLHALLLLTDARRPGRIGADGRALTLEAQDRATWDAAAMAQGRDRLASAMRRRRPGPYQLQAAIAAVHADAPDFAATDWAQIAALYTALVRLHPTAAVRVNHAVAVGFSTGPQAGLALLEAIDGAAGVALPAARAGLLARAGATAEADAAYAEAIAASANGAQREELAGLRARAAAAGTDVTSRSPRPAGSSGSGGGDGGASGTSPPR